MKPQVVIEVRGGVAEVTSTDGDVEVVLLDWDNVFDPDLAEDAYYVVRDIAASIRDQRVRTRALEGIENEAERRAEQWERMKSPYTG